MVGFTGKRRSPLAHERELQRARATLFLPVEHTEEDIRSSFSQHVKAAHPDTFNVAPLHDYSLDDLRKAKDILLKEMESDNG